MAYWIVNFPIPGIVNNFREHNFRGFKQLFLNKFFMQEIVSCTPFFREIKKIKMRQKAFRKAGF
jgi:hypothetical protein